MRSIASRPAIVCLLMHLGMHLGSADLLPAASATPSPAAVPLVDPIVAHSDDDDDDDDGMNAVAYAYIYAGSALVLLAIYSVVAYSSWTTVRYRTGFPLLLLLLTLLFPPLFLFVLLYLLILQISSLARPTADVVPAIVGVDAPVQANIVESRALSQAERRQMQHV